MQQDATRRDFAPVRSPPRLALAAAAPGLGPEPWLRSGLARPRRPRVGASLAALPFVHDPGNFQGPFSIYTPGS